MLKIDIRKLFLKKRQLYTSDYIKYNSELIKKNLFYAQIVLSEIGALLACIFMYWGGYVGSSASYSGMSEFVVGVMMEFATIPSGLGIGLILFGNLFGIINIILAWKE